MKVAKIVFLILGGMSGYSYPLTYTFSTIDSPGFYKLAANVSQQITISASDVTLDLNGHTVSGGANGIVINSLLSNVTLKNGTISSVTTEGILVNASCTDITLKDITIKNAIRGINFEQVSNGLIRNCDLTLNTTGIELDTCHNIVVENCSAQANTNAGYSLLSSTTCSFFECKALSTGDGNVSSSGDPSFVFGFVSSGGTGNLFENCVANSTQNLAATDFNSVVVGIALKQSEQCSKIISCEAGNSTADPDGFAVPYGIWLEGTLDSTQSVTGIFQNNATTTHWSPDGQYAAVGGDVTGGTGDEFQIIFFERVEQSVRSVDGALGSGGGVVLNSVSWSPDGQYIAVGGSGLTGGTGDEFQIFSFSRITETLTSVAGALGVAGEVNAVSWSPDEQYIAVGGSGLTGGTGDEFQVVKFDRIFQSLTSVAGALGTAGAVNAVSWSPDEQYIAVGGSGLTGGTGDELQVFRFERSAEIVTSVDGALGTAGAVLGVSWSPDGQYIALGGDGLTGGNELQVFSFNRTTETLTSIAGALGTAGAVLGVSWSPDGQYIAVGGSGLTGGTGDELQIFRFDRTAKTLTSIAGALGTAGTVNSVPWSPDGQYIAITGLSITGGSGDAFQILDGIQFPSQNVIQNNTVYCNASNTINGAGISGSSIANMIIGNTAFDNPFNYQFVTNVFNQLFGQGPSGLQNKETRSTDPICTPEDIPQKSARIELLLESLIDNLL